MPRRRKTSTSTGTAAGAAAAALPAPPRYDVLGELGRGTFGAVYHVRDTTTNQQFALKRVPMPVRIKALAKPAAGSYAASGAGATGTSAGSGSTSTRLPGAVTSSASAFKRKRETDGSLWTQGKEHDDDDDSAYELTHWQAAAAGPAGASQAGAGQARSLKVMPSASFVLECREVEYYERLRALQAATSEASGVPVPHIGTAAAANATFTHVITLLDSFVTYDATQALLVGLDPSRGTHGDAFEDDTDSGSDSEAAAGTRRGSAVTYDKKEDSHKPETYGPHVMMNMVFHLANADLDTILLRVAPAEGAARGAAVAHYAAKVGMHREQFIAHVMYQVFLGIANLHSLGIAHRDLKPNNVLILPVRDGVGVHAMVCDLGAAKDLSEMAPEVDHTGTNLEKGPHMPRVVVPSYRAPELCFGSSNYTTAIDIWSCGCILGELFLEATVFAGETASHGIRSMLLLMGIPTESQLADMGVPPRMRKLCDPMEDCPMESVMAKNELWRERGMSDTAIDLLTMIFDYSPSERPTAEQCLEHAFFDDVRPRTAATMTFDV